MSITLAELRTQARQIADMENNNFIGDPELNNYINFAIAELHDLLIHTGADYFLNSVTGTTIVDQTDYALPTDFYKLKGVDAKLNGSDWINIRPFNFNERNRFEDFGSWTLMGISNVRYRIMGANVKFNPTPDGNIEYRIWYIPVATKLSSDTDILDDVNQYSDYVIISAAMKMLQKEESDVSMLAAEKERLTQRVEQDAKDRDFAQPESVSDIYAENNEYYYWTTKG